MSRATSGNECSPYGLARRLTRSRTPYEVTRLKLLTLVRTAPVARCVSAASASFTNRLVVARAVFCVQCTCRAGRESHPDETRGRERGEGNTRPRTAQTLLFERA